MIDHLNHLALTTADEPPEAGPHHREDPVMRSGAVSRIRSVYVRDPDLNLIEISELKG